MMPSTKMGYRVMLKSHKIHAVRAGLESLGGGILQLLAYQKQLEHGGPWQDEHALAEDWQRVGSDLQMGIESHGRDPKDGH